MAKHTKGSRYHPARVSGHAKFLRAKDYDEQQARKRKKRPIEPVDMSKSDWSLS